MDVAAFKRSIRDLQVWCSSCMVAFSGADPIGVLIGAKRASATLIHRIAVHPDHVRQGHGRHLLTSLGSKLAILGPPRIVAEVPEDNAPARALFASTGFVEEAVLTDYVWEPGGRPGLQTGQGFIIPVTIDDLAANGLLSDPQPPVCWERSVETLTARKDDIAGVAVANDEEIEAYILHIKDTAEPVALRAFGDDPASNLSHLLTHVLRTREIEAVRFPKVHPGELSADTLEALGLRPAGRHFLYATVARSS